jgi:DGQHR domain-containing protein
MPEYPAIYMKQRGEGAPLLVSFCAPAGQILEWADIDRLTTTADGGGHQRIKNESKVRAITRFLQLDDRNSIPTAVTIALTLPDVGEPQIGTCSTVNIPGPGSGVVIDGQHRLYGIDQFDPTVPVNVIGLINCPDDEIAFQFLVINNKATKVSTDHLKLLSLQYENDELADRLRSARMVLSRHASMVGVVDGATDSPFHNAVAWPTEDATDGTRLNLVRPAAIEQALAAIAQQRLPDLQDDDAMLEFFFVLWRTALATWPEAWNADSNLLSKVGVVALTTFVIEDLVPLADRDKIDLSDPTEVEAEVRQIFANIDQRFWTSEWTQKSLDTSAGRRIVIDALQQVRRNSMRSAAWTTDVNLVPTSED